MKQLVEGPAVFFVTLFLLITAIVLISQLFDASRSIYSNVANGKKSDQPLLDISPVNSKMDKIDSQSLFSQPYIFYFDSTHQHFTRNEIVDEINLANDDISLTASIAALFKSQIMII